VKPYYQDTSVTIYHADCRDVLPTLRAVDLVLTDPPYNVGKDYGTASDSLPESEYEALMRGIVSECRRIAPNQAWVAPRYKMPLWWSLLPDAHEIVIPCKATNAIRGGWVSQFALVMAVGTPPPQTSDLWEGIMLKGTGYFFREETYGHPGYTPYPIMERSIGALCPDTGTVLDPFMGTGTTLRAANDLGRTAIGIEVEERYCEIAAKRMSQMAMPL
jgi:site-specific DNA-methyltransferase (adenine-specific)